MSARHSIVTTMDAACDGGVSPNAYRPFITTQIRVHFPPNTVAEEEVEALLRNAYMDARAKIEEYFE